MKRFWFFTLVLVLVLAVPATVSAQINFGPKAEKVKVVDKKFTTLATTAVGATVLDVETTFADLKHPGIYEANPITRPFVKSGRPATYAVGGAIAAGESPAKKGSTFCKFWVPVAFVVAIVAGHAAAGGFGLR